MAYPHQFHRLVIAGDLYTERFATSLSIYGSDGGPVNATLLTTIASVVGGWFQGTSTDHPQFISAARLTEIKLNRIGTDGKYVDPESFTHYYSGGAVGPTPGNCAPQLAAVVSLRTAVDRGRASKGRMYLPPMAGWFAPGDDGRVAVSSAQRAARSVSLLINSLNAAYAGSGTGGDFNGRVAIESDVGAGAWHFVTHTTAGRVIDTMRSRRSSLDEDVQTSSIAIT